MPHPSIIQGGMGVAASSWRLAKAVSQMGQVGVISGTLLAVVLARRLQEGDPCGSMRRALAHFPIQSIAEKVITDYYVEGGKKEDAPYKGVPMPTLKSSQALDDLIVAANFTEVFLAKEGHKGVVGINLLEKLQLATLPSLYGAMLAGVDYVLMGAGIPKSIPGILDLFSRGEKANLKIDVDNTPMGEAFASNLDPQRYATEAETNIKRPQFLAIVASATLATTLAKKSSGQVNGFVVEGELAGGHNAPPRGALVLNEKGEPVYGDRDIPDLAKIRDLGLPFWLAGTYGRPGKLSDAKALGAEGIQVGTAFAFCEESGIAPELRRQAIAQSRAHKAAVFTDPKASPTGFPFKVAQMEDTLSEKSVYEARPRVCDLGYLRTPYRKDDGSLGYRCPAEPDEAFLRKGGKDCELAGRKCLCNGLLSAAGHPQKRSNGYIEPAIVTAGNDFSIIADMVPDGKDSYTAADVVNRLLA